MLNRRESGQRFIIKLSIFLLGAFALIRGLSFIGNYFDPDPAYESRKSTVRQLLARPNEVEALAVGNSHSAAINFDTLGYKGFHIWHGWGDMFEVKYQLEALVPRLPKVSVVFISTSYFSFDWDTNAAQRTTRIRQRTYATTPSTQFIDWDLENYLMGKLLFGFVRPDHWEAVFLALLTEKREAETSPVPDTLLQQTENSEFVSHNELTSHARFRVDEQVTLQREIAKNHPDINSDTYETVVSMIDFLQEHNVRTVFYTPPYFEMYTDLYDQDTINRMKQNMEDLKESYGVEYYDFSADRRFITSNTVFKNSDHLNEYGAQLFSTELKKAMIEQDQEILTESE